MAASLITLPIEILYLIVYNIDNSKDLRAFWSTCAFFRLISGPHTITAQLWFSLYSQDLPSEHHLRTANEWRFPLDTEYAKRLIIVNAPPEPTGLSSESPGPRRALRRQERVLHIVERFGLFLHNMLAVNYYYPHDWDALREVADDVEQYLEDLGWVQFYRGQMDRGIDSLMVSTVQTDQEFEAVAFEDFSGKLRAEIAGASSIPASSKSTSAASSRHNSTTGGFASNRNSTDELFASLYSERMYLRWTSLIQDQLNFFGLERYILEKFKPPDKLQLAEYLRVVLFGDIDGSSSNIDVTPNNNGATPNIPASHNSISSNTTANTANVPSSSSRIAPSSTASIPYVTALTSNNINITSSGS
ncbi:10525_t:CDS:1 [Paraglomus brasilianum]|uniref:10525_t:CDS:1 n=1 Tax=Paraglomus brasilianum TaxID=144538 RepID=A0A9N9A0D4_9GLOM|nr:10525_t:CDS:1 [Paraglomus brasilianum]